MPDMHSSAKRTGLSCFLLVAVLGFLFVTARSSRAQTLTILHSFGAGGDGLFPTSGVILDAQGNLYGETPEGGNRLCGGAGCGTLFKLTQSGSETVLYRFPTHTKGCPTGGLIWDAQSNLYGTAESCINGAERIYGGVFELEAGGELTWPYLFKNGGRDGQYPGGGVIMDGDGNLYGTTWQGGYADGTIFELKSTGKEVVLHSFIGGNDGANPLSGLILDGEGNLYGTTPGGGGTGCEDNGCGIVFEITPGGKETVLYRFTGGADGGVPSSGVVFDGQGNLYGTTFQGGDLSGCSGYGCGVVFKLTPAGVETTLYSFTGGADGGVPQGEVVFDSQGNLYGTTLVGGSDNSGTVFELTAEGSEIVLHTFAGGATDGALPESGLVFDGEGNLYGTTRKGGAFCEVPYVNGCGTVFKLTP